MRKQYILSIFCFFYGSIASAIVPTTDIHQLAEDTTAITSYAATMGLYLQKLGDAMTVAEQIKNLHSLDDVSKAVAGACRLCEPIKRQQLATYIKNVDSDLCSQFQYALENITGIQKSITSISDLIGLLQTNPKEAGLALQRAAIQSQMATQNTLAQIQLLMAQQSQKQIAEDKLEKSNTDAIYNGFKNAGL